MSKPKNYSHWITLAISLLFGAFVGVFLMVFIDHLAKGSSHNDLYPLWALLIFFASFFVQIIVHEAGHLVFGAISGYRFVSFRILRVMLVRDNGKLKMRRYHIPGTAGQALMMPPEGIHPVPYVLYNLGGVLMNFIVSASCLLLLFVFSFTSFFSVIILATLAASGILIVLTNGIPMVVSGVPNDGKNLFTLKKDDYARHVFWLMLQVNGLQSSGTRLRDMPEEWFVLPEQPRYGSYMHMFVALLRAGWHMDRKELAQATECLDLIRPFAPKLAMLYRLEWQCEMLFCELMGACRSDEVEALYTKELKKYVGKSERYQLGKKRLLYAYALLVENDTAKADKLFAEAKRLAERSPNKGEAKSELELIEWVREMAGKV